MPHRFRIVLALVALLRSGAYAEQPPTSAAVPEHEQSPASNEEIFGVPDAMTEGTNVHFEDLVVRAKSGVLMRVAYGKHEIFVAPLDPSTLDFIAIGAHIDVRGTLVKSPSARQAQLVFAMGSREARRLARSPVYVDAWSVSARG